MGYPTGYIVPPARVKAASLIFGPWVDSASAIQFTNKAGTAVLCVDTTNKRVGIGTAAPSFILDVVASAASCNPTFTSSNAVGASTAVAFTSKRSRGSVGSEVAVNSGDTLASYSFQGHTGSAYRAGATITIKTLEAWDGTHGGAQVIFQTADTGTTLQTNKLVLSSALVSILSSFLILPAADATTLVQWQDSATTVWLNFDSTTGRFGFGSGNTSPTEVLDVIGNIKLSAAGNGIKIKEGSNATMGTAVLVLGTKTVSTTAVTANSRIFLQAESLGTITSPVALAVTGRSAGTSFTITSANLTDTSTVAWIIIEPA